MFVSPYNLWKLLREEFQACNLTGKPRIAAWLRAQSPRSVGKKPNSERGILISSAHFFWQKTYISCHGVTIQCKALCTMVAFQMHSFYNANAQLKQFRKVWRNKCMSMKLVAHWHCNFFLALINSRLVQWKVGKYFCGFARYIKLGGEKRISGTMGHSLSSRLTKGRLVGNNKQATNIEFVCPGNLQKPPFQTFSTAPSIFLMKVGGGESYFLESCWLFQIYILFSFCLKSY